ncbi:hypothetical protein SCLCIDRAFT_1222212 [Scleroderma citrinum Foug A]|uniref:Uncharacterized protein n=1 Tax=Scleroderma citrinum Foug A TaxID=1036808 RepID=A0A0C3D0B3_9AGAM|nr:hypothetical protein SCLCIDRAFT_1222212 [Scleroderma citrinum Foug A]
MTAVAKGAIPESVELNTILPVQLGTLPTSLATTPFACIRGILSAAARAMHEENSRDMTLRKRTVLTASRRRYV